MYLFNADMIECLILLMCVDVMVRSSAYVVSFTGACGVGATDV